MSKKLKFCGIEFELINEPTKEGQAIIERFEHPYKRYTDIYDAYSYPSSRKVAIWDEWQQWFKNLPDSENGHEVIAWEMFIGSRCTSNFTISAMATKGNRAIYMYITRDHNKAVII